MKAQLLSVVAGSAIALAGCTTPPPAPPYAQDNRTQAQRAEACLERFTPGDRAPQIMTYDSKTGTEVHMNTDGSRVEVTGRNSETRDALGMGGEVGGSMPVACTDEYPAGAPTLTPNSLSPYNGQ